MNMKKSTLSLAVCSGILMTSAAMAQDKYGLASKSPIQGSKNQTIEINQANASKTWLVKVNTPSLAQRVGNRAQAMTKGQSTRMLASINSSISDIESDILALGLPLEIIDRTSKLASALVIRGESEDVRKLTSLSQVVDILPVYDYQLDVADSAAYMNATSLVDSDIANGANVHVAVLDTGADYTHSALGGEGTAEAYAEAIADPADTPAWPMGNVVGGWDFINNDPDPIDVTETHGTHVTHSVLGLAPEASVYVYSVCEATCPGAAQLAALEAAMDPNGDGDISDRVDVINMSLGGDFGTSRGGAVADLLNQAVSLGVVATISAGNDGATPFIVGGPSTTDNVLSVGAMTHPTTEQPFTTSSFAGSSVVAVAAAYNAETAFSIDNTDAELVYPDTNQNGCVAFAEGVDFSGQAVLMDRGECAFVTKTNNAQEAGAEFVVVTNNREGAPFVMSGDNTGIAINSVMISQADGDAIKTALDSDDLVEFTVSSELRSQTGAIAGFTSRGPSVEGVLKPEITAPGVGILTAEAGLGDGLTPISGTSFSSPMTAGAMSLLTQALPDRNAFELKATIMNAANLDVTLEPRAVNPNAELAPISFIGAGLVDVEKAVNLPVAAWATETRQAALAFGYVSASSTQELTKNVTIKNFSNEAKTYSLSLEQRYANDIESGAVDMNFPDTVTVPAGQTVTFDVTLTIDPTALHEWTLDDSLLASEEGSVDLTVLEYDGALNFSEDGEQAFHLVYHVLPKAFAEATVENVLTDTGNQTTITNTGAAEFSPVFLPLTVNNGVDDELQLDLVAGAVEIIDVPEAFCESGVGIFSTFMMREGILSPNVAGFFVDFDMESDGTYDFTAQAIAHTAFDRNNTPGVTVSFTRPFDELSGELNNTFHTSGNNGFSLLSCIGDIGLTVDDLGTVNATVAFRVEDSAFDFFPDSAPADDMIATEFNFGQQQSVPQIVDASGEAVSSLVAGESAFMTGTSISNVIMSSNEGNEIQILNADIEANVSPVVAVEQVFDIDENTENGTTVGIVQASDEDLLTSPVSEIFVESSSSNAFNVSRSGVITVANEELLDFDAGFESSTLSVVAIDTQGNVSEPATVIINVNNLVDSVAEMPAPPPVVEPSRSSGGGATGLLALLLIPLTLLRRRNAS